VQSASVATFRHERERRRADYLAGTRCSGTQNDVESFKETGAENSEDQRRNRSSKGSFRHSPERRENGSQETERHQSHERLHTGAGSGSVLPSLPHRRKNEADGSREITEELTLDVHEIP
jgi:hypothetical protein